MGSAFIGKAKVRVALYSAGSTFRKPPVPLRRKRLEFPVFVLGRGKKAARLRLGCRRYRRSVKRISDVTGSIDLRHFSADNLALALWGTTAVLSATPIVAEAGYKIVPLMFIPTKRLINTSVAPVVKRAPLPSWPTTIRFRRRHHHRQQHHHRRRGVRRCDHHRLHPQASNDVQALISSAPTFRSMSRA